MIPTGLRASNLCQLGLPLAQRQWPKVLVIKRQQIERVQHRVCSLVAAMEGLEPGNPIGKVPGYVVRDANGQALAYIYSRESEAEALRAKGLTKDEARRIAVNVARLPELGRARLSEPVLKRGLGSTREVESPDRPACA